MKSEEERWEYLGSENYEPTPLVKAVIRQTNGQISQRAQAGLVAIAMVLQSVVTGKSASLEQSAKIVSEHAHTNDVLTYFTWDKFGPESKSHKLTGDIQTIKRNFRKYSSVAHILAAWISCANFFELFDPFELTPEADLCFLQTVLYYQNSLHRLNYHKNKDILNVWVHPTCDFSGTEPLLPTNELIVHLFDPWFQSNPSSKILQASPTRGGTKKVPPGNFILPTFDKHNNRCTRYAPRPMRVPCGD